MRAQLTILTLVPYYLPGCKAGGPIQSIANLVELLGDEFRFLVATYDHDLCESRPYPGVKHGEWMNVGKARVRYLSASDVSCINWRRFLRGIQCDVLYVNGFFPPRLAIQTLFLRALMGRSSFPLIVAPRGEFFDEAMSMKAWKKRPCLAAVRALRLCQDAVWHATNEREAEAISRLFGTAEVVVASNLAIPTLSSPRSTGKTSGALRLLYVGRIHPVKNLTFALSCLRSAPGRVEYDLYGVMERTEYWNTCQSLIAQLPPTVRVNYKGAIPHDRLRQILPDYDAMFLPTQTENFGHAIIESLLSGVPVLTSDRTPWRGLQSAGAGWDLPLDRCGPFQSALEQLIRMDDDALLAMRHHAIQYAKTKYLDSGVVEAYRDLFHLAASKRRPSGQHDGNHSTHPLQ